MKNVKYVALDIFDFDQTLVNSPGPETLIKGVPAREAYDQWLVEQGLPKRKWSGWYGRSETLLPPIFGEYVNGKFVPPPECLNQDVAKAAKASYADPSRLTVLMTGRHIKMINKETKTHLVKDIMDAYGVTFDRHYFLMSGQLTLPFKCNTMEMLIREFKTIRELRVWEDREEHVSKFYDFAKWLKREGNLDAYKIHAIYPNQPGFNLDGVEEEVVDA